MCLLEMGNFSQTERSGCGLETETDSVKNQNMTVYIQAENGQSVCLSGVECFFLKTACVFATTHKYSLKNSETVSVLKQKLALFANLRFILFVTKLPRNRPNSVAKQESTDRSCRKTQNRTNLRGGGAKAFQQSVHRSSCVCPPHNY
jgi:hypothetical protein